jgi:hypothetical protein
MMDWSVVLFGRNGDLILFGSLYRDADVTGRFDLPCRIERTKAIAATRFPP